MHFCIKDKFNVDENFYLKIRHKNTHKVGFNGRSAGYLVLYNKDNNRNILSDEIVDFDTYEEFRIYC